MKKMNITCILLVFVLAFSFIVPVSANTETVSIYIDGYEVPFSAESGIPYVDENYRTMVPLRLTMESAGLTVDYDAAQNMAIVFSENTTVLVPIDTNLIYINGDVVENDTITVEKDGRTYLPIRAVLEAFGFSVRWDDNTNSVIANTDPLAGIKPETVVGKVGDYNIYAYELKYLMSMGYDVSTAFDEIATLKVMQAKADEKGVKLTEDEIVALDAEFYDTVAQYGGKEALSGILSQYGLTFEQYKAIMDMSNLVSKFNGEVVNLGLFKEVTEAEAKKYFDKYFIKAKHILFSTVTPETGEAFTEEEALKKMALATETLAKIKAGADFDSFSYLNEDPGSIHQPDGYIFAVMAKVTEPNEFSTLQQAGYAMVPEFEAGADALKINGVSELVQSSYGIHIIKRVAMTKADFEETKESIINILNNAKYLSQIEKWKARYGVVSYLQEF